MLSAETTLLLNHERNGRAFGGAIGAIFLSAFGLAWILLALAALNRMHLVITILLACFVAALLASSILTIRRIYPLVREQGKTERSKQINRMFGLVNAVQWIAIFLAVNVLKYLHLSTWIVPTIIFIVGAHFIPLAYLFRTRLHFFIGVVLMVWAVAAPLILPKSSMEPLAALGIGAILWITAMKLTLDSVRWTHRLRELS